MTDVRVSRLRKRYRVRPRDTGARERFDRLLAAVMSDGVMDAAMERAGIPPTDDVCVRRVDLLLRDASMPDSRLLVSWSVAIADAIAASLREDGPNVVRYSSRHQAIRDMTASVSRRDLTRAWAWRQL